jgi:hypothetical protein
MDQDFHASRSDVASPEEADSGDNFVHPLDGTDRRHSEGSSVGHHFAGRNSTAGDPPSKGWTLTSIVRSLARSPILGTQVISTASLSVSSIFARALKERMVNASHGKRRYVLVSSALAVTLVGSGSLRWYRKAKEAKAERDAYAAYAAAERERRERREQLATASQVIQGTRALLEIFRIGLGG